MNIKKRKQKFMEEHIGLRTREQLSEELFEIYLVARSECPDINDDCPDDTWPLKLHLADVLSRYVFRNKGLK